ncbi:MAG TPA: FAD-dependent oxidoreductase, partial [Mycobacterium sp.]|nr:FAD-dependent oxidoreductase [Mycobacterium sp.]
MEPLVSSPDSLRVVIAGAGFAALETLLALRAIGGRDPQVALVAPGQAFTYRPAATAEAFDASRPRVYDLRAISVDLGACYHRARLEAVSSRKRHVRLSSGRQLSFDFLVLGVGARATASIPGAEMFRDQRDVRLVCSLLREVQTGAVQRVVFALPAGPSWPVPLYELALLLAARAAEHSQRVSISIVGPEPAPLAVFGEKASQLVSNLLGSREISFVGGVSPSHVRRDGSLALRSGGVVRADRVISTPQLRGPRITGVPADRWGFVPIDASGRVQTLPQVYAAGDMT